MSVLPRRDALRVCLAIALVVSSLTVPAVAGAFGPIEPPAPAAPTLLSPAAGATSVENPVFTWTPAAAAIHYDIEVFADPALTGKVCGSDPEVPHWMCLVELKPGTYYWRVRGVGVQNHVGTYSAVRSFVKLARLTTAPTLVAPVTGTSLTYPDDLALLRWSAVPNAAEYLVQISEDPTFAGPEPALLYAGDPTESVGAPPDLIGVTRYWRVRAVTSDDVAAGPWSSSRSFVVLWPDAPHLTAPDDGASHSSFVLRWDPMPGAAGYDVEMAATDDPTFSDPITADPVTAWLAWPASDGVSFLWRVRGRNAWGGRSTWSAARTAIGDSGAPASPPAPALVLPAVPMIGPADGTTNAIPGLHPFDFEPVAGATTYHLQWGSGPDPFTEPALNDWHVSVGPIVWDADAGQTYSWRIRAEGPGSVTGPWSSVRTFATPAMGVVALTGPPNGASRSYDDIEFTWTAISSAPVYDVQISATPDFASFVHHEVYGDPRFIPWDQPAPGTWYWRVTARRGQIDAVSAVRSLTVTDSVPPVGRLILLGGSTWTHATEILLDAPAEDAASDVAEVATSADGVAWTTHSYPPSSLPWSLVSPEHGGPAPGQRDVYVRWRDSAGNWSAPVVATVWYGMEPPQPDTTKPTTTDPIRWVRANTSISDGKVPVRLTWTGTDSESGVVRYEIHQITDFGVWWAVATNLTSPMFDRLLAPQHTYQFRVRAIDAAGNVGDWSVGPVAWLSRYNETSPSVGYSGSWRLTSSSVFWMGAAAMSSTSGSKATFGFSGRSVAFVSRLGPTKGKARIYLDGALVVTIDLHASTYQSQRIVWARNFATTGKHIVVVQVSGSTRIDVDAFVVGT